MSSIKKTNDLTQYLYETSNKPKKEISKALFFVFQQLLLAVIKKNSFKIVGFGEFRLNERKERSVLHPATQKRAKVPKRNIIFCKFSKSLYLDIK
ncbi:hypothetical protein DID78_04355 [Candidatus Marinamargulisbacteria bacterium SCGC AG-343-D04]|nr:hypothetical protein DID78_04355 [Candidatus Marinamargulisbacteria bacterium SCGC AG-343-D04]